MLFLVSCVDLQITSSIVPDDSDAFDLTEIQKINWGNNFMISANIDKSVYLTPLTIDDYIRMRVSISDSTVDLTNADLYIFEDGNKKGFVIDKLSTIRSKIDIVIILDTTGSMGGAITGVKNSIIAFAEFLNDSGLDVRLAIIPYDDYAPANDITIDGNTRTWLNLSSPADASVYANKLYASGGAGTPENSYEGFIFAWNELSWRDRSEKIFINITDAPSHYFEDGQSDSGRSHTEWKTKAEVLSLIRGKGVIHTVLTGYMFNATQTDFSNPGDARSLSVDTGGMILYEPSGNVDLTTVGIAESIVNSYILTFKSTSSSENHEIELFVKDGEKEGKLILQQVEY